MDQEELRAEIERIVYSVGQPGEELVSLATMLERSILFEVMRDLIVEKIAANDDIAVEVLSWAWKELTER